MSRRVKKRFALALAAAALPMGLIVTSGPAVNAASAEYASPIEYSASAESAAFAEPAAAAVTLASPATTVSAISTASAVTAAPTAADSTAWVQVQAGHSYSVALRADGTVWTWGRSMFGELGVLEPRTISSIAAPARLAALSDIVAISSSSHGAQAGLRSDGSVWEWGAHADAPNRTVEPRPIAGLTNAASVAAVDLGGFALKKDGALWAWTHSGPDGEPELRQVPGTYRWASLNSNANLAYALDGNGAVWVLGLQKNNNGAATVLQPVKLAGVPAMKQISANSDAGQMVGVDRNGTAWQWRLRVSTPSASGAAKVSLSEKPVKLYPELKIASVQAGASVLLLTQQGDVWTIGKGINGKEGKVKGLSGIQTIASGYHQALAIDAKGRMWGWGGDQWNEAGVVRTTDDGMVYAPVQIQKAITVTVDGQPLTSLFPARMDNGLTSVPLKDALNALGGSFSVTSDFTFTINYKQATAVFRLAEREVELNGQRITLPSPAYGLPGVTMVPVSLLKQMGVPAEWNGTLGQLNLRSGSGS